MSAAKFFIPGLPGLPDDSTLTLYGGHIPSAPPVNGVADTTSDAHLFFFLIRNRHIADTERTVFWCVRYHVVGMPQLTSPLTDDQVQRWAGLLELRRQLDGDRTASTRSWSRRQAEGGRGRLERVCQRRVQ